MKNVAQSPVKLEDQLILWSGKPVFLNPKFNKWYSIFPTNMGVFEKIIGTASIVFALFYITVSGFNNLSLIILSISFLLFFMTPLLIRYVQKIKFRNTKYILTKDTIEIKSWHLIFGSKVTKINLKEIAKTYLLGVTEDIGTVFLYNNADQEKSRDLLSGSRLETMALQYVRNPKKVKALIDQHRLHAK